jgi:hypothetical protein
MICVSGTRIKPRSNPAIEPSRVAPGSSPKPLDPPSSIDIWYLNNCPIPFPGSDLFSLLLIMDYPALTERLYRMIHPMDSGRLSAAELDTGGAVCDWVGLTAVRLSSLPTSVTNDETTRYSYFRLFSI